MRISLRLLVLSAAIYLPLAAVAAGAEGRFTFSLPPSIVAEAQAPAGATVVYTATAKYDRHPADVSCQPPSAAVFGLGQTIVVCTATYRSDDRTVSATASFPVTVRDTTPPALHLPASATVHTNRFSGLSGSDPAIASFLSQVSATDIVDGSDGVASDAPVSFGFGLHAITFTAVDRAGNRAVGSTTLDVVLDSARKLHTPQPGAVVTSPPSLSWARVGGASFYNVQLYRGARKLLSAWPTANRFRLHTRWAYHGKTRRLSPGVYTWYVWPGFGAKAKARYGKLIGASTFTVA